MTTAAAGREIGNARSEQGRSAAILSRRRSTKVFRDRPGRKTTSHSSPGAGRPVDRKTAVAKILQGAGKRIRDDDAGQGSGNRCAGIRAHTGRLDREPSA